MVELSTLEMIGVEPVPVELGTMAKLLKALADPKRLLIVHLLMEGVHCNCELGEALDMAPNLISHHLRVLRQAGLVDTERDPLDARWVYYSLNRQALEDLNKMFSDFFDSARIKPRRPTCGPQATLVGLDDIVLPEG
jgi:ArsR family transcriptional regulator, arsenate/arsenite/antimonite-responsive transcriptional repressor